MTEKRVAVTETALLVPVVVLLALVLSLDLQGFGLGQTNHNFPQYAIGGGARTFFNIYNPSDHEIVVSLAFHRSNGTSFFTDARTVGSQDTVVAEFGGEAGSPVDGWVSLSSSEPFAASEFFAIPGVGNVGVPASEPVQEFQFFSFSGGDVNTGFAVANPNALPSVLNLRFLDPAGTLLGTSTVTLPPQGHLADFLSEEPYNFAADGRVEVTSDRPVVAMTLRTEGAFLTSAPILAPAAAVAPPPAAGFTEWERVIASRSLTIGADTTDSVEATCPEGKRALGGGGWSSGNNAVLVDSWPLPPGERTWVAIFWNHKTVSINTTIRAYVICAVTP